MRFRTLPQLFLFAALVSTGAQAQVGDALKQARDEIKAGRAAAAFERLAPLEDERAGDAEFDYLLGLAALESGQASRASLIFERVLIVQPNHAAARLDLGRSFAAMGAHARAQEEFDAVRAMNPPPDALKTIEAYEASMRPRVPEDRRLVAWAEAAMGRDSNVNQATSASSIFLPVFNANFTLSDAGRERNDTYRTANAGARYGHPVGERLTLLIGGEVKARRHGEAKAYDTTNIDGNAGVRWGGGDQAAQLLASHGTVKLAGEPYRKSTALSADWRRGFGSAGALDVFGQFHRIRYEEEDLTSNDVNLAIGGAGWMNVYAGGEGQWFASGFTGLEKAVVGRVDGNKKILGVRAGVQQRIRAFDLGATASLQIGRYADENPLFLDQREDRQADLTLVAGWRFTPAWSLRANATLTRNDSNFSIYDYNRRDVSLGVRYDFR